MAVKLYINGVDADTLGVFMGDDFLSSIAEPAGLKDFIQNESRLEDGIQIIHNSPKLTSRDVTLEFYIIGSSQTDFYAKLTAFQNILNAGLVKIRVPEISAFTGTVFNFTYLRSQAFAIGNHRYSCKMSVKFLESNPKNRAS